MTTEEIQKLISDAIASHTHTNDGSQQIQGQFLVKAPQPRLTTASSGILSSGGGNLSTADNIILNNALTRISELESKLKTLGLIS